MEDKKNKISVIIPVYNVANYLEKCVNSIIRQDYKNLQIILVDDGSTDNSGNICDNLSKKDDRIIVITKPNGGLSSARNAGMKIANGEYISFIDSDDFINTQTYSLAMSIFEKNSDVDLVEWDYRSVKEDDKDEENESIAEIFKIAEFSNKEEYITANLKYKKHIHIAWNKIFKSHVIKNYRFPIGKIHEDLFFTNEYMFNVKKAVYIPLKLHYYVQRNGSIVNQNITMRNLDGAEGLYQRHLLLKQRYSHLLLEDFRYALRYHLTKIKAVGKQKNDENKTIRLAFVNILLRYYDYVMQTEEISQSIKEDFILAKKDVYAFLKNYEIKED